MHYLVDTPWLYALLTHHYASGRDVILILILNSLSSLRLVLSNSGRLLLLKTKWRIHDQTFYLNKCYLVASPGIIKPLELYVVLFIRIALYMAFEWLVSCHFWLKWYSNMKLILKKKWITKNGQLI